MYISGSSYNLEYLYNNYQWFSMININGYPVVVIFWNLFLLLVPYALVVWLARYWEETGFKKIRQKIAAAVLGFVWLLFIPNAAYVINDVRHLINYCPIDSPYRVCAENAWMIMFFFVYASVGWVAFVYLLNQMKNFIGDLFKKSPQPHLAKGGNDEKSPNPLYQGGIESPLDKGGLGDLFVEKIFIIAVIPIISLGVLLGLLNRWNSWEIFIYPTEFLKHILLYFTDSVYFGNWLIFTAFLYILYFGGNTLFKTKN